MYGTLTFLQKFRRSLFPTLHILQRLRIRVQGQSEKIHYLIYMYYGVISKESRKTVQCKSGGQHGQHVAVRLCYEQVMEIDM